MDLYFMGISLTDTQIGSATPFIWYSPISSAFLDGCDSLPLIEELKIVKEVESSLVSLDIEENSAQD